MIYWKYLIAILFIVVGARSDGNDIIYTQIENVKKSIDILNLRLDILSEKNSETNCDSKFLSEVLENFAAVKKTLDILLQQKNHLEEISELEKNFSNLFEMLNAIKKSEERLIERNTELEEKYLEIAREGENRSKSINILIEIVESLKQKNFDMETKYLELLKLYENVTNTNDILKKRVYDLAENEADMLANLEESKSFENSNQTIFNIRVDELPKLKKSFIEQSTPIDCEEATKYIKKSGYYKIFIPVNKTKQIMVYCDTETEGGDWLHIIRRHNGSENFARPWSDYVNGFGNVELDYWLGLENLHALTNNNGQQEIYVYIENYEGESRYAFYDNFVVGNASELYKLKSVGTYNGTAGDDLSYSVGSNFSTIDIDNDSWLSKSCAQEYEAGWWYKACFDVLPTGKYYMSPDTKYNVGVVWGGFGGIYTSNKIMYLMIRKAKN